MNKHFLTFLLLPALIVTISLQAMEEQERRFFEGTDEEYAAALQAQEEFESQKPYIHQNSDTDVVEQFLMITKDG
jgi:hypothetical protein